MDMDNTAKENSVYKLSIETDLSGKVAVVTGAGGVLGSVFAAGIAAAGAKIALLDLRSEAAEAAAQKILANGGTALPLVADVLSRDSLEQAQSKVVEQLGQCDILINCAGGNHPVATTDQEYWLPEAPDPEGVNFFELDCSGVEFVFDLNFLGSFLPTQVFARDMVGRGDCSIINISSMNAWRPLTKIPAYSGAKAAISNFTQWLAVHFSRTNIRVNAIAPGFFVTEQNRKLLFDAEGKPTPRTEKILSATPMGRFGEPEELLGPLLFLLSPSAAGFITGLILPVDGGFSAYSGV